jgi:hypothetical protein
VEALSYVVLVLLSLVGYSGGATGRAGKNIDLKPVVLDLILVVLIWSAEIYSRLMLDFNKWLMILVWVGASAVVGIVAVTFRRLPRDTPPEQEGMQETASSFFQRFWHRWKAFSRRMGSFQSRVMLSLFFFIIISPAAVLIKGLGDPLRIKKTKAADSYWLTKAESSAELEDFRRQF